MKSLSGKVISLLLVLPLLAFALSQSLEVLHPIEEGRQPVEHHHPLKPGQKALCVNVGPHPSHFCVHILTLGPSLDRPLDFTFRTVSFRAPLEHILVLVLWKAVPRLRGPPQPA